MARADQVVALLAKTELFGGLADSELQLVAESFREVHFGCRCSPERLAQSLASLPRADIESLMEGGKPLEIECDYCRKRYEFTTQDLRSLMQWAVIASAYRRESRTLGQPFFMRFSLVALAPLGRLLGYRPHYARYCTRPDGRPDGPPVLPDTDRLAS